MATVSNPSWWKSDYDSAWDRIKDAFARDWEQTKHDFGSDTARDLNQNVDDTVAQAAGTEPIPPGSQPNIESGSDLDISDDDRGFAQRFGYGASQHYGERYSTWNDDLDRQLRNDWSGSYSDRDYDLYRNDIRGAYDYGRRSVGSRNI